MQPDPSCQHHRSQQPQPWPSQLQGPGASHQHAQRRSRHHNRASKWASRRAWLLGPLLLLLTLTSLPCATCAKGGSTAQRDIQAEAGLEPVGDQGPGPLRGVQTEAGVGSPVSNPALWKPEMLADCMLRRQSYFKNAPITWTRAMKDEQGALNVHAIWWSKKKVTLPITVVTQLSASRLQQLSAQCKSWPGALSAAIYVPLMENHLGPPEAAQVSITGGRRLLAKEAGDKGHLRSSGSSDKAAGARRKAVSRRKLAAGVWSRSQFMSQAEERIEEVTELLHQEYAGVVPNWPGEEALAARQVLVDPASDPNTRHLATDVTRAALGDENKALLERASQAVHMLYTATEALPWACSLNIVLVYEVVGDVKVASLLYPVNQLRNLARLQARTDLIAQLDVDMLMSSQMASWLKQGSNAQDMVKMLSDKAVYIMPAFEVDAGNVTEQATMADDYIKRPKRDLVKAVENKLMVHFDQQRFPIGHNTTNFPRWYQTNEAYAVKYSYRFEPWLVVHRKTAPWHDVRFRGYGNNKIQQVCHLNATGHTFLVHPVGFIVHRAHAVTDARKQLMVDLRKHQMAQKRRPGITNNNSLYGHTKLLFERAKAEMDVGIYAPVLDPATRFCKDTLPWYQGSSS